MIEDRVRHILTDEKLSKIKSLLEKNRAIDCIFLLYLNKGRWKDAKEFVKSINLPMNDGIFRSRMMELGDLHMLAYDDGLSKKYHNVSDKGKILAELLIEFFEKLEVSIAEM